MPRWHTPVDPRCPAVETRSQMLANDPMVAYSGCGDEIWEDFERQHMASCKQCQEYGAANIEVV